MLDKFAHGEFILNPGTYQEIRVPNNIVIEGKKLILQQAFQDRQTEVAAGANYYIGLGNFAYDPTLDLTTISELAVSHGYARSAVSRDATGWPTLAQIQNAWSILTKVVNFTAAGGDFSGVFNRLFLCTVNAGSSGKLISVSSALATPILITNGQVFPVQYQLYLN